MRISTNTMFTEGSARLSDLQSAMQKMQQQLSTGHRILTPADDPIAAAQVLEVSQAQAVNTQYGANRKAATGTLSLVESSLASVNSLMQDIGTLAVSANTAIMTNSDRATLATQLSQYRDQLLSLANSDDGKGNYLFSGYQMSTKPFTLTSTGAQYNGDQGQQNLQVGTSQQVPLSSAGDTVFNAVKSIVTAATNTNVGNGVVSAATVTDSAALSGHIYTITFTSPTTYDITQTDSTPITTVSTRNNYVSGQAIAFPGMQLNISGVPAATSPLVSAASTNTGTLVVGASIASPNSLTGSGYRIDYNSVGTTYTITRLSDGAVVYPANAVFPPAAPIDGINFNVVSGAPAGTDSFMVQPTGDTFTVSPTSNQSVFKSLTDFINILQQPTTANVATGTAALLSSINQTNDNVLTARATVGSHLKELDSLDSVGTDRDLQYSQTLSNLQDLDYAKAASTFAQQQTTLQAAQKSFLDMTNLSLFSLLR